MTIFSNARGVAILAAISAINCVAQQPSPHAGYIYPAGGRQRATVEVRVGGQFLNGAKNAYVSGKGVEAKVIQYVKPLTGAEAQKLRDEMQELVARRQAAKQPKAQNVAWTDEDEKKVADIREKLEEVNRRPSIPSIAEIVLLQITIASDAAPGLRKIRVETPLGLTNSIAFFVGELPEYSRKTARVRPAFNVVNGATPPARPPAQSEPPMEITLPAVVNGQMMPATADRYRFHATRGQQLVIEAAARELMPYLSDAVPGWFQAVLTLRDAKGKELASADHYLFHPDPLLHYVVPEDGDYVIEVHDSIYRGREDFVYRVSIGELPFITSIFPLGSKAGGKSKIETRGWNLPVARIDHDSKHEKLGVYPVWLRNGAYTSNTMQFAVDTLPETIVKQPIGERAKAKKIKLPMTINGAIERSGQSDFFRFDARAGDEIVAEVTARRLGSPLDSVLRLTNSAGKELASNDDFEDKGAGLITHQADPRIIFTVPAKGAYYLQLADAQHQAGPEYVYRLRISHLRPDFELRVVPSSLNMRAGSTVPISVYAVRKDGFSGEIALELKDAPDGFVLAGAAIPSGQEKVRLTITAPRGPINAPLSLELVGQAVVNGREVRHTAVPAQDMMQAFAYHHLVVEDAWMVRVIGTGPPFWPAIHQPVKLTVDGSTTVRVLVPPRLLPGLQMALNDPPDGISIQSVTPERDGVAVVFSVEGKKAKAGLRGNLILDAVREVSTKNAAGAQNRRRQALGALPAIPFEIVESSQARR